MTSTTAHPALRDPDLERALHRARRPSTLLAAALVLLVLSALRPAERGELEADRLVLTGENGEPAVVLVAGPGSSLVIETPSGREVLRLGGPPARRIGR